MSGATPGSSLLLDELLEAGDARVLPELLRLTAQRKLAAIAHRLVTDERLFARDVLRGYIADGCDRPGHRVFVKTVFKAAEKKRDLELMGHFAVAFDRLVARTLVDGEFLRDPPNLLRRLPRWRGAARMYVNPVTGVSTRVRRPFVPLKIRHEWHASLRRFLVRDEGEQADPLRFTISTRRYLQRRTWRFFRQLSKQSPTNFREQLLAPLAQYRDEHLTSTEALLDSWFLVHALYGTSPVLERRAQGIVLADDHTLAELAFAPYCPAAWTDCLEALMMLALTAQSRPVRRFAVWALETNHAAQLQGMSATRLLALIRSPHEELQSFGGRLLDSSVGLEKLPITDWLALLSATNLDVLTNVCAAVKKHVSPTRLSLAQCVQLACARAAPVAELGLEWAKARKVTTMKDLEVLLELRRAEAKHVREQGVEWISRLLVLEDNARPLFVRELLDARHVDVREAAMALMKKDSRFGESFDLWLAMSETPYADVRDEFLKEFEAREHRFAADTLARVWATTLLSVHRGSRAKRHAARQVADRMVRKPDERLGLVKLLSLTLRSVRQSERKTALAQLVRAATDDTGLRELLKTQLPELTFLGDEVTE